MSKTEKLNSAYKDLQLGKIIEFIPDEDKRISKTGCRCWVQESFNGKRKYICWNHFGSSANTMSIQSLRWIAKVIGKCTTYKYKIVNSVYDI